MKPPRQPLFLARQSYRRRRLMDAARLLPIFGLFLFALPLMWPRDAAAPDVAREAIYLFIVWALLVAAALVLSARLVDSAKGGGDGAPVLPLAVPDPETAAGAEPGADAEGPR